MSIADQPQRKCVAVALKISIKEFEDEIAKHEAAITNRMKDNELLKTSVEFDLAGKNDCLMLLNLRRGAYQAVCFRHCLSRQLIKYSFG